MKRILSLVLSVAMVIGLVPMMTVSSSAAFTGQLRFDSKGEFTIVQLTDIQDDEEVHEDALALIAKAMQRYEPDLVVLTGDNVAGKMTEANTYSSINQFMRPIINARVPYAVTFGNHDDESGTVTPPSKDEQYNYYVGLSDYAVDFDVDELSGTGTGGIPIYSYDGSQIKFAVFPIDSGTYEAGSNGDRYDYVKTDQINYYKKWVADNGSVPHIVFQHIIVPEIYTTLLKEVPQGTAGAIQGHSRWSDKWYILDPNNPTITGRFAEQPCPAYTNNGQYQAMVDTGCNVGFFVGHDHTNSFEGVTADGIRIGYTPAVTMHSYGDDDPACRVFTVKEDGSYTSKAVLLSQMDKEEADDYEHDTIAGVPTAPARIIVGAADNGLHQQRLGNTIQQYTVNHRTQALYPNDMSLEIDLASNLTNVQVSPQSGINVSGVTATDNGDGTTNYKWTITGGTAPAGTAAEFEFTYENAEGTKFTQYAYSYVDEIRTPAGYYINTRNFFGDNYTDGPIKRHRWNNQTYVMTVLGDTAYGDAREQTDDVKIGYDDKEVPNWTNATAGYYNYTYEIDSDEDDYNDGGFVGMGDPNYALIYTSPSRAQTRNQPNFERFKAEGKSPVTTVYIDSSVHTTMDDLNLRVNYWRHGVPKKGGTGEITFKLNFKMGDASYTAENVASETAGIVNIKSVYDQAVLSVPRSSNTYLPLTGTLPADGTKYTVVSQGYSYNSNGETSQYTYLPVLLSFVSYNKAELRELVNAERSAMRQTDDIVYRAAFKEAYRQVNKINTTQKDIDAAVKLLSGAVESVTNPDIGVPNNSQFAGTATVPPVIYIAGENYGLSQQPTGNYIKKGIVDYASNSLNEEYSKFYFKVPQGASDAQVTVTESNGNTVSSTWDRGTGVGQITGGTSSEHSSIIYKFSYTLEDIETGEDVLYEQIEASAVLPAPQAAGWTSFVKSSTTLNQNIFRTVFETAILFGHAGTLPAGAYYTGVDVFEGANYGINLDTSSNNNFVGYGYQKVGGTGMAWWEVTRARRAKDGDWLCAYDGEDGAIDFWNDPGDDMGHRARFDITIDSSVIPNLGSIGTGFKYLSLQNQNRATNDTSNSANPTVLEITNSSFFNGFVPFSDVVSGNNKTTAVRLGTPYNAEGTPNDTTYGVKAGDTLSITYGFEADGLPPAGNYTYWTELTNNGTYRTCAHYMWNFTINYVDRTYIRNFIAQEDEKFRQLADKYDNSDGSFTAYQNALAKAKAAVTDVTLTDAKVEEAQTELSKAIQNLKYLPADFTELDEKIAEVIKIVDGQIYYRPNEANDPTYYKTGEYYHESNFSSTNEVYVPILKAQSDDFRSLDIRQQSEVNRMIEAIEYGWVNVTLLRADYSEVDKYLDYKSGTGENGAAGGAAIIAPPKYSYLQLENTPLPATYYTAVSYNAWTDACAIGSANRSLKKPEQNIVDGYALALKTAYNDLTLLPAEYAPVEEVMAAAKEALELTVEVVDPSNAENNFDILFYDDELIAQFNEMYNAVDRNLTIVENTKVEEYADELDAILAQIYETLNNVDLTFANEQKNIKAEYEDEYEKYYTADSWQKLVTARAKVNDKLASRTAERQESEVNAVAKEIYDARNALVYNKANYDKVNEFLALIAAKEANKDWYKNWNEVETAVAAVVPELDMPEQGRVDTMANDLETAYYALELKDASYEDLKAAIDLGTEKNGDAQYYTDDTYANFLTAYQAANKIYTEGQTAPLKIDQQGVITTAENNLRDAIGNLKYKDANMEALFAAMTLYEQTVYGGMYSGEYPDSDNDGNEDILNNVMAAYAVAAQLKADYEAGKLTAKDDATIATAANTLVSLRAALPASYLYVYDAVATDPYSGDPLYDFTKDGKLSAYIPTLEAELKKLYTDASVKNVVDTLNSINYNLKIDDQETVNNELSAAVAEAMYQLEYKPADLTKLLEAIAAGEEKVAKAESANWFTDETWADYEAAYGTAVNVRDADPAYNASEQNVVNDAEAELVRATNALAYKDAEYDELNNAIAKAKDLNKDDWTPETWADLETALAAAEAVKPGLKIDSQADIDTKVQALADAIKALKSGTLELVGLEWTDTDAEISGKTIIDNERGFIYGLIDAGYVEITDLVAQGFVEVVGNGYIKQTPFIGSNLGTGSKIELIRGEDDGDDSNNEVVKTYYIVIFGDNTGDGWIDEADVVDMINYDALFENIYDYEDMTDPHVFAMDINKMNGATTLDLYYIIEYAALKIDFVDQTYSGK